MLICDVVREQAGATMTEVAQQSRNTLLHFAAGAIVTEGVAQLLEWLIVECKLSVTACNKAGETPLHLAATAAAIRVLIKHGADSVVARLNLSGERDILTILSGRERTVRMLDELRAEHGDDPDSWLAPLLERA